MTPYKFLRIAGLHYNSIKDKIYLDDPELHHQTYATQQQEIFKKHLLYSNSLSKAMNKLGHEAHELIYDLEILQQTWAQEQGISFPKENWQNEIVLAQIEKYRPDIVYFQDIHSLTHEIRKNLKTRFPFIKLLVIFRGFPGVTHTLLEELSVADILLTGSPVLLDKCMEAGLNPHLLYHSFDPDILQCLPKSSNSEGYDFSFVGSSGFTYGLGHHERYWTLHSLLQLTPIKLWIEERGQLHEAGLKTKIKQSLRKLLFTNFKHLSLSQLSYLHQQPFIPSKLKKLMFEIIAFKKHLAKHDFLQPSKQWQLPAIGLSEKYANRCAPPVFGLEMYQILDQSKVTFNIHSTPAKGTVDNIRLFQATGVGTCLLSDTGDNLSEVFEKDHEIVTYSSHEECLEKLTYLLENEETRKRIASNGQKRTLQNHTTLHRAEEMCELFKQRLNTASLASQ